MFLKLASCDWIRARRNYLLTGPSGVGKSCLACALGYIACRENLTVFYQSVPRLFAAMALARGAGRYARLMKQLACVDLLILDDWRPEPLLPEQQRDLLEQYRLKLLRPSAKIARQNKELEHDSFAYLKLSCPRDR